MEQHKGKTIESVTQKKDSDGFCKELTITFADGTTLEVSSGEHLHQIPPFTSVKTAHLDVK